MSNKHLSNAKGSCINHCVMHLGDNFFAHCSWGKFFIDNLTSSPANSHHTSLIEMSKKSVSTTPTDSKLSGPGSTVKNEGKKVVKKVTIEVNCKQYKMIFPADFNRLKKKVTRGRSTRSKSKTSDVKPSTADNFKIPLDKPENSSPSLFSKHFSSTGFKLSRKKTEVLGCVNSISGGGSSSPVGTTRNSTSTSDTLKREKRKRFVVEDNNEIAAENIPLESAFPPLQFGIVNKNISPKKRRKLQTLISPKSPTKIFPFI